VRLRLRLTHMPRAPKVVPVAAAACGCGCTEGREDGGDRRKAVSVDPDVKARNITRLRRIEGQVRGLQNMVEQDRYCADVMTQISSVHEALRAVGRALMRNHLKHCATAAIRGGPESAEAMYNELVDLMYKHAR
jgi:CsoR family transcriptional regulator, copper-sensing transcriptional repressor